MASSWGPKRETGHGVIRTSTLIPRGFDAVTLWPFILVRPSARNDAGLIEHELVHYCEQAWCTPIWWARYLLSPAFRQAAEVRAYRRQIAIGGISLGAAAHYLATGYRLNLSYGRALSLLTEAA